MTPSEIVLQHRPLLRLAVEALRQGTLHEQAYVDWMDEQHDTALGPALVRKGAKRYLLAQQQNVQDEETFDHETEFLSNLGLMLTGSGIQMRVLKSAPNNMLPVPGASIARQDYYNQAELQFDDVPGVGAAAPPMLKLVLHWSTDAEYNLHRVYLGCPRTGGETRLSVEAYWDEQIWRRHGLEIDGQVQADVADVDIYIEEEATGTEG